jgi:hypothetical protein
MAVILVTERTGIGPVSDGRDDPSPYEQGINPPQEARRSELGHTETL